MREIIAVAGSGWIFLILAAAANIAANSSLKNAAQATKGAEGVVAIARRLIAEPSFWLGIAAAGVLLIAFVMALRTIPVSLAYLVVTSLAVTGLMFADTLFFGATLGMTRLIGAALVIAGVTTILLGGASE